MKYFVLMVMTSGLAGCPGISWDIGIGRCDGARITEAQRRTCAYDEYVVCRACTDDNVCSDPRCVSVAQRREYLETHDADLPDWTTGLADRGPSDGGLPDSALGDQ